MKLTKLKFELLIIPALILFLSCNDSVNPDKDIQFLISPNPLSSYMDIRFKIPYQTIVSLYITDNSGREVIKIIENKVLESGLHNLAINFQNQPSGVYSCILKVDSDVFIKEFTVIR